MDLPDFAVFVWLRKTDGFAELETEVLGAAEVAPYEATEYAGMAYLHWRARDLDEAKGIVDALLAVAQRPELVLLQIMSRVYGQEFISIKDRRKAHHS